jgi:hypothetical protein
LKYSTPWYRPHQKKMTSSDVVNILNVRTALPGAELDSFRKAAEAMIDTLYAKHQAIPPEIWEIFFNTRR